MKSKIFVFAVALAGGLFLEAGANATPIPGWAGMPDPMTETACWAQDGARLRLAPACFDSNYHTFSIPLNPLTYGNQGLVAVSWTQNVASCGGGVCVGFGDESARAISFNPDGTISGLGSWNATAGTQLQTISYPIGGTVMLQVRMKTNSTNSHWVSSVSGNGVYIDPQ
ncbi:MAG TPA: hypothetical protein VFQ61_11790 [Polyangiaceae bacterium]|nr:hypothetical protein [Polyangiaceae bacterium]